jgi:hypothetical protein
MEFERVYFLGLKVVCLHIFRPDLENQNWIFQILIGFGMLIEGIHMIFKIL